MPRDDALGQGLLQILHRIALMEPSERRRGRERARARPADRVAAGAMRFNEAASLLRTALGQHQPRN